MNPRFLPGLLLVALGLCGLLAGCVSQNAAASARKRAVMEYRVIDSSIKRAMTPLEEAELRVAVLRYLEKHRGQAEDRTVKFYLPTEEDSAAPEWVIVEFSKNAGVRYEGVATYPRYYWQTGPYYSYDYYPWGYDSFGRFSVQYYDDWIYTNGHYIPRQRHPERRDHGRHNDRDGQRDGRDRDRNDGRHQPAPVQSSDQAARRFKPSAPAVPAALPIPPSAATPANGGGIHPSPGPGASPHREWSGGRSGGDRSPSADRPQRTVPSRDSSGPGGRSNPPPSLPVQPVVQPYQDQPKENTPRKNAWKPAGQQNLQ
jgi:hypothetical protein